VLLHTGYVRTRGSACFTRRLRRRRRRFYWRTTAVGQKSVARLQNVLRQ
jgi:hypothetical protein